MLNIRLTREFDTTTITVDKDQHFDRKNQGNEYSVTDPKRNLRTGKLH